MLHIAQRRGLPQGGLCGKCLSRHGVGEGAKRIRRAAATLLAVALVSLAATGCSDGRLRDESSPTPSETTASASPSLSAQAAWTARCTTQVSYWTVRLLDDPEHSYDYQEMGLSGQTYEALREVKRAADGRRRSSDWVERHSAATCAAHASKATATRSPDAGWP